MNLVFGENRDIKTRLENKHNKKQTPSSGQNGYYNNKHILCRLIKTFQMHLDLTFFSFCFCLITLQKGKRQMWSVTKHSDIKTEIIHKQCASSSLWGEMFVSTDSSEHVMFLFCFCSRLYSEVLSNTHTHTHTSTDSLIQLNAALAEYFSGSGKAKQVIANASRHFGDFTCFQVP